jgi:hypothetical protein
MFNYRHLNFIYDEQMDQFKQVQYVVKFRNNLHLQRYNTTMPFDKLMELASGPPPQRKFHLMLFQYNLIDIPVKNHFFLLIDEILHPFYIFQIISIIIWLADEYYVSHLIYNN